jgi:hypothetical protein
MPERVSVRVLLVVGDQAEIVAAAPDAIAPERYPAAEVAAAAGIEPARLAGRLLIAEVGADGRLRNFRSA